ncbi:MAG: HEAT repeat domain-containing protein [Deltaproteobacteria bacterium]|nr:HEAT repeat domain-containing protein [Deltaproteobacteria bacterium]
MPPVSFLKAALLVAVPIAIGSNAIGKGAGRDPYALPPPGERDKLRITYFKEDGARQTRWVLLASGKLETTDEVGGNEKVRHANRLVSEVEVRDVVKAFRRADFFGRKRIAGHPDDRGNEFLRFETGAGSYTISRKNDHWGGAFDRLVAAMRRLTQSTLTEDHARAIQTLDAALKSKADEKPDGALDAIRTLRDTLSTSAVPTLVRAMRRKELREPAAEALGWIGDRRAAKALLVEWKQGGAVSIALALGLAGDRTSARPLHACLRGTAAPEIRAACAVAVGELRYPRANAALVHLLRDESAEVRAHAAEALGRLRATSAIEAIIEALTDNDANVVVEAVQALGLLRHPMAREPLKKTAERLPAVARLVEDALLRIPAPKNEPKPDDKSP